MQLREGSVIEKTRYAVPWGDLVWEIDVFSGENAGLSIAENLLPYDGEAILIHDSSDDFDRAAVTRTLIGTMPWQVETARIFGRELAVPRMTAWFGDAAYRYSGILHQPAPLPTCRSALGCLIQVL
jgi:alkylated DNA repair dioxygenase AlkB